MWVWSMGFRMQDEVRDPGRDQIQDSLGRQVKSELGLSCRQWGPNAGLTWRCGLIGFVF